MSKKTEERGINESSEIIPSWTQPPIEVRRKKKPKLPRSSNDPNNSKEDEGTKARIDWDWEKPPIEIYRRRR